MFFRVILMHTLKQKIRTVPHFPKEGIMFRDITTLLKDAKGFRKVVDELTQRYVDTPVDLIVAIESRGFILGGALAHQLGKGFVPLRKKGKLPFEVESVEYELEYGKDKMEIHKDALEKGMNVVIIDDLLATGGTALAALELVEKLGAKIMEFAFIIELPDLGGRKKLEDKKQKIFSMVEFEGD